MVNINGANPYHMHTALFFLCSMRILILLSILTLLLQGSILVHFFYVKGSVEICGDGVDNNKDGQIEENCDDKEFVNNKQSVITERNSITDYGDNQRANQEKESLRSNLEESSFYEDSEVNQDINDAKNGTRATGETPFTKALNSTQRYQAYERSTVELVCQICIEFDLNSINVQSYTWNQVGGAHPVTLSSHNTSKTSFVAPEINSPVDALNFVVKAIDDRGMAHSERVEILVRNAPGT